jgi:FtsH-binding integral membrane protein
VTKRDFSFLGKFLFVGLVVLIVASLANLFFQVPAVSLAISAIAVMLFSMYLLFDLTNIVRGGETNYVMATLNLFLDMFNIFISLLNLLLAFSAARLTVSFGCTVRAACGPPFRCARHFKRTGSVPRRARSG